MQRIPFLTVGLLFLSSTAVIGAGGPTASPQARKTPDRPNVVDAKIDSQLLQAIQRKDDKRQAPESLAPRVDIDRLGRALVDVRADVTESLLASIRKLGGRVMSSSPEHRSIIARIPLDKLRRLAENPTVRFIEPAADATTNRKGDG